MAEAVGSEPASIDPRIRRTRQMLHEALEHLLRTESIERVSVSDIAEQATLNRATFYDHYPDKYALLEGLVAARFQELLSRRDVIFSGPCPAALRLITLATCDYLASLPKVQCPGRHQTEKHLESAIIAVIRKTILAGIEKQGGPSVIPPEVTAAVISGAIYGGAREWMQAPNRAAVSEIVNYILSLVSPMLARD